ncbi:MAG: hypothetical protein CL569_13660 [Alphaproteobacteria bacterium]|nr:hypothetical protein [Alphaproteobacteria bacterium]
MSGFLSRRLRTVALMATCLAVCLGPAVAREGRPLFELGVMAGGGYIPDYPAADESRFRGLALPYIAYRGEILRSDEKGLLRSRLIHTEDLEFDISLNGSFPVDSDDNDDRNGLPDLDWLGEIGPCVQLTVARAPAGGAKVDLELPVRAVFSTDLSDWNYRGIVVAPEIAYQHENFLGEKIQVKLGLGASFATVQLTEYFYEVAPQFATATRPAFSAESGYLGTKIQLAAFKSFSSRWRGFAGLKVDLHHGAANEDSPLFKDKTTFSAGLGIIWSFYQSEARGVE